MAKKTESVAIKVSPEEKELIKKLAEKKNTTVSRMLAKIVFDSIKESED
jgi:uncharacterized protein (DUF1778 family)